jgi:hypothetical protein
MGIELKAVRTLVREQLQQTAWRQAADIHCASDLTSLVCTCSSLLEVGEWLK